ncbi:hypothetical protein ACFY9N_11870 [Microbacterium sp. NPDC008134]|uniref:hypothetical protein n=1 Tax=Microbacterium sp. NPDC008134 TaxID=3364183 RepID=UPI0036E85FFA
MLTEANIPDTDDWWLMRLANRLGNGLPRMEKLRSYRDGDALLPADTWDAATSEQYLRFMRRSRLHVAETLRDARTDRQEVIAFRTSAAGDENGDLIAQAIWDRSRMAMQSVPLFNDLGDFGRAYIITTPDPRGKALWQIENEWTTISEQDTRFPWVTRAAITVGYNAILRTEEVTLFRPGYYRVAYRSTNVPTLPADGTTWTVTSDWTWVSDPIRTGSIDESIVTQLATPDGAGIYEKHLDTLDRINEITLNALTLIVMQSFRQRAVMADLDEVYPEDHPKAGQEIDYDDVFRTGPAALWTLPASAKMWESAATDVRPIYEARKDELKDLCTITRTPMSLFDSSNANQSALGSQISHQPLVNAVNRMNRVAGVSLAQAMSQSLRIEGQETRSEFTQIAVEWAKVNPATLAEKAEAAPKFKGGGATQAYIDAEVFEMTPQQRRQAETDRADEAFNAALALAPASRQVVNTTGANDGE